ncbi:potassium channel, subfamily K, member 7 [Osmerus eperlanus]|uniref:potassium channel, subfamily K, member 7 n=1 Tax=Osmerus eperlanus TaxID=29151 RepID=UPI002E117349
MAIWFQWAPGCSQMASQATMVRWLEACRHFCRVRSFWFLVLGYVLFTLFGGLVFMAIEMPVEKTLRADVQELKERFLEGHRCVKESQLDDLLKKALSTDQRGVSLLEASSEELHYDFTSSLFFVIVTLSTTGYDFFTPISEEAKLFCIFYCTLGIPLTLFLLSCLSDFLLPLLTHGPVRHLQTHWGMPHSRAALLHTCLLALVIATVLFLLPAMVFYFLETEWRFLDALFFCFLTLSTIGQGGYAPGASWERSSRETLKLLTTCYLMFGLIVLLAFRDTALEVPLVQALFRMFSGPREGELRGMDLDEMVLGGDCGPSRRCYEEPQYSLPISTISFCPLEQQGIPSPDQPNPPPLEYPTSTSEPGSTSSPDPDT